MSYIFFKISCNFIRFRYFVEYSSSIQIKKNSGRKQDYEVFDTTWYNYGYKNVFSLIIIWVVSVYNFRLWPFSARTTLLAVAGVKWTRTPPTPSPMTPAIEAATTFLPNWRPAGERGEMRMGGRGPPTLRVHKHHRKVHTKRIIFLAVSLMSHMDQKRSFWE